MFIRNFTAALALAGVAAAQTHMNLPDAQARAAAASKTKELAKLNIKAAKYHKQQVQADYFPKISSEVINLHFNKVLGKELEFVQFGRTVRGVIQGESHPREFIPRLVDYLMDGKLPADRMMTFYPLAEINRAARDSTSGAAIKPVLSMPG